MKKIYTIGYCLLFSLISFYNTLAQTVVPFTTPGNSFFTVPAGVYSITVSAWGAGGAGGGTSGNTKAGGGGAGGSFVRGTIDVTPGQVFAITVGIGGLGASNSKGGDGLASTVVLSGTTFFKAVGGAGGAVGNNFGAGGSSMNTGNIISGSNTSNFYGGTGGTASNNQFASSGGGGGSAGAGGNGGNGGVLTAGSAGGGFGSPTDAGAAGAAGRGASNDGNGITGVEPGAGGSGSRNANNNTNYSGGNGGNGRVNISYLAPVNYRYAWIFMNVGPTNWCVGETRTVQVTVKNAGLLPWTDGGGNDFNIGVKWNADADYFVRADVANLAPGSQQTFSLTITAPNTTGNNNLTFDIVWEGHAWFGNNNGNTGPGNTVYKSPDLFIAAIPNAPTGISSQLFCTSQNATIANLSATGTNIKWYSAASSGVLLPNTTALVNGAHYFASQTNVSGCESTSRLDVTATINTNPSAPTGNANQSFCVINNPKISDLTATGSLIQWYSTSSGGTVLSGTTALSNGDYFASQTVGSCESVNRFKVTVALNNAVAPTGASTQSFCAIDDKKVADLVVTGANIKWYATAIGGSALPNGSSLVNSTHYYASQTPAGCEGTSRFDVLVNINNPAAPIGSGIQNFCSDLNSKISDLIVIGTAIKWYLVATGGVPLASSTPLINGMDYYASQTISGCEGAIRLDVTVNINPAPSGNITLSSASICAGSSVTFTAPAGYANYDFRINGTSAQNSAANTFSSMGITNGDVVTVLITSNKGCQTTLTAPSVIVNAYPTGILDASENSGIGTNDNIICQGGNVAFTFNPGYTNYRFILNGVTTLQNGSTSFYNTTTLNNGDQVSVEVTGTGGCTKTFGPVTITVTPLPVATLTATETSGIPDNNSICIGENVKFTATAGFANYDFRVNGTSVQSSASNIFNTTSLNNNDAVSVVVTNANQCSLTTAPVIITVYALPTAPIVTAGGPLVFCLGGSVTLTAATATTYQWYKDGTLIAGATLQSYTANASGDYTVAITNGNSCGATSLPVTITVNPLPAKPTIGASGLTAFC